MVQLSQDDHLKVSAAIAAAELRSNAEIVAVATELSDPYHDVALHWAVLALFATLAAFALYPPLLTFGSDLILGAWRPEPSLRELLTLLLITAAIKFTVVLLILRYKPLRLALTPGATKTRRVRRRAIQIFKAGAERRTVGRTGILIYLSMGEHRAEIVADEAIVKVTDESTWGEAMAALVTEVKADRIADGLVAAIERVGDVCATHFPRTDTDRNEIPDKLIEL